jgi:hypothetical protein
MAKDLRVIERDPDAVARALAAPGVRVFALPAAQLELQWRGFEPADPGLEGLSGVAEIRPGGACAVVRQRWRDLPALGGVKALSMTPLSADSAVTFYVGADERPDASLTDVPATMAGEFERSSYKTNDPAERARLAQDGGEDGLPEDADVRRAPFVMRLKLWRPPAAAATVGIGLPVAPTSVLGRVADDPPAQAVVCPAFVRPVQPLRIAR